MTAFDENLIDLLTDMATDGDIRASAAELADALDCSTKSIQRGLDRLENDGRLSRVDNPGQRPTITLLHGGVLGGGHPGQDHTTPLTGGCGVGVSTPVQGPHTKNTPPGRGAKQTEEKPKLPAADRDCPRCEGTGMVFVDIDANVVTVCECRGPETIAHVRARQAANQRSWGSPAPGAGEPEAKPDYTAVWLESTRRALADAVKRHPAK